MQRVLSFWLHRSRYGFAAAGSCSVVGAKVSLIALPSLYSTIMKRAGFCRNIGRCSSPAKRQMDIPAFDPSPYTHSPDASFSDVSSIRLRAAPNPFCPAPRPSSVAEGKFIHTTLVSAGTEEPSGPSQDECLEGVRNSALKGSATILLEPAFDLFKLIAHCLLRAGQARHATRQG